ncbi:copper resistance system multicopper oxidase [Marinobacterium rhizophilum]|uniref:copper resistance system multicopper oxidase n=1 Tax=Marinobacterium rhizophilum TaxID=420402 RepID=UPI001F0A9579|nr:copper resistance system multicopper oxidase [Marinobacterium rhizophilum]
MLMSCIKKAVPLLAGLWSLGALAGTYNLVIGEQPLEIDGQAKTAMTINGGIPGPTLRFKEGEDVTINVTNNLDVDSSIHWHGLLLPYTQDGVPGISYPGIRPGETFTYRFPIVQAGTYWYHSHSGFQEQEGVYGAIAIEPAKREPFRYDREYVVMLSDWSAETGEQIFSNLKGQSDYYNYSQQTLGGFLDDVKRNGFTATLRDRLDWGSMRMMPTDIADVSGYSFLVNGKSTDDNWTGLFEPGERVRLRFINGSAMTYFDVRIPGLKMTVVQADGNNVQPVSVDEFRIAVAETYDVIVQPKHERAFSVLAESVDRSGFARGTLAPRDGMKLALPDLRERPLLTMADMSMASMGGMDHGSMDHSAMGHASAQPQAMDHAAMGHAPAQPQAMDHAAMGHAPAQPQAMDHSAMGHAPAQPQAMDHSAMGHAPAQPQAMDHSTMAGMTETDADYASGSGLAPSAANGGKFLAYGDLKAMTPYADYRAPDREIELRLTGNMERYFWSINGTKFSDAEPIRLTYGERVRLRFVNDTMMMHPMHLHGMWQQLDKGNGRFNPLKHVVNVAPNTTLTVDVPVDALGEWAFHCHLMYHMASGMFRKVIVEPPATSAAQM